MQQWDRSRDGLVTYQEFEDYYKGTVLYPTHWILADQTLADQKVADSTLCSDV